MATTPPISSLTSPRPTDAYARRGLGSAAVGRVLLASAILMPIQLTIFVLWADARTPGYSHIRSTISQLSAQGRPEPAIMTAGFLVFGALAVVFAVGLYLRVREQTTRAEPRLMLASLCLFGVALILAAVVRDYDKVGDTPANLEGFLHSVLAGAAFVGIVLGMIFFVRTFHRHPDRRGIARFTAVCGIGLSIIGLMFVSLPTVHQGVYQRCLFALVLIWIVTVAIDAARWGPPKSLPSVGV